MLRGIFTLPLRAVALARAEAGRYALRAQRLDLGMRHAHFSKWAAGQAAKGAIMLHRIAKAEKPLVRTQPALQPSVEMEQRRRQWARRWLGCQVDHQPLMKAMRQALLDDGPQSLMPRPSLRELRGARGSMRSTTGRGVDAIGPANLALLPEKSEEELLDLLGHCENLGTWSWQLLLGIFAMLPKPAGG